MMSRKYLIMRRTIIYSDGRYLSCDSTRTNISYDDFDHARRFPSFNTAYMFIRMWKLNGKVVDFIDDINMD